MDFFGINGWEMLVLLLLAMFIFGPDRLPKAISDGVRMVRNLRDMARNATGDLSRELGTEITLEDLNPKTLIRKHILSEEDERMIRKPLEELYRDVQSDLRGTHDNLAAVSRNLDLRGTEGRSKPVSLGGPTASPAPAAGPPIAATPYAYDADAT